MNKLEFIWHDGFILTTDQATFVFDYWKDPRSASDELPESLKHLPADKPVIVLISHGHKDHFSPVIYMLPLYHHDVYYVVSKDVYDRSRHVINPASIYRGPKIAKDHYFMLKRNDSVTIKDTVITAFGSTDIGNSYMITLNSGYRIFHAGDLNAWLWKDESTHEEVIIASRHFKMELANITEQLGDRKIDLATFPLDSRIGTEYYRGAKGFLGTFKVKRFVPMHCCLGKTPEQTRQFQEDAGRFELYFPLYNKPEAVLMRAPGDMWVWK